MPAVQPCRARADGACDINVEIPHRAETFSPHSMFYFHAAKSFHVNRRPGADSRAGTGPTASGSTTLPRLSRQRSHRETTMADLVAEGRAWGLAGTANLAEETLSTVLQLADTESPHKRAHAGLAHDITRFASNLLTGRAIGL
jgi:hypothetical protein